MNGTIGAGTYTATEPTGELSPAGDRALSLLLGMTRRGYTWVAVGGSRGTITRAQARALIRGNLVDVRGAPTIDSCDPVDVAWWRVTEVRASAWLLARVVA